MAVNLYKKGQNSRRVFPVNNWIQGLSDYNKQGGSYVWARGVDYRSEPSQLTLLPQAVLESTSVITDLVKWSEQVVGRTINPFTNTNLISNYSFETNTTGWTLGADFTRSTSDSYIGTHSVKQVSTSGSATFTTASGSGSAVTAYSDYQLTFYVKLALTSGQVPTLQVLGGSLSGPNLLISPMALDDTGSAWIQVSATFNAGQYTSVFVVITNGGGNLTAYYDNFQLLQINSIASFALGNKGGLYKRYQNSTWVSLGTVSNSHGNGLAYYGEDDYLYVMGDKTVGRYGPVSSGTPTLVSDYLNSAGGVPTNTNSIQLIAANSDYAAKATPTSVVKITGDIALEAFVNPSSLPAVGSSMTLGGLWKETGNLRAYKLDVLGVSAYFGSGTDSTLTVSVNTTDAPIDSSASGILGTTTLNATNASFAAGQIILIHQTQGTGAGTWQRTTIQGYDGTNHLITTQDALNFSYNSSGSNRAQVLVLKQYSAVTVNNGVTLTTKAWNGTVGGILGLLCSGTVTVTGNISASGSNGASNTTVGTGTTTTGGGFRGGAYFIGSSGSAYSGEGNVGPMVLGDPTVVPSPANGNGGGGAGAGGSAGGPASGGGNGTAGDRDGLGITLPGSTAGSSDLVSMVFGGGGGGGSIDSTGAQTVGNGGSGGGIVFISATSIVVTGSITANGGSGGTSSLGGVGGSGAGGSILLKAQTATLGTGLITASGGARQAGGGFSVSRYGGAGGDGRVVIDYLTSVTGTTTPTVNQIQDNTLVTQTVMQVRLGISNDGTANEFLSQNLKSYQVGVWDRIQVSWNAAASTASFYENGVLIGTSVGTKTAIYGSSTGDFAIGANFTSAYANFFDGLVNDFRVWNQQVTAANFAANNFVNLGGVATGLVGSWFTTASVNDATAANNLTLHGSPTPVYSTSVPYAGATARLDVDKTGGGTGSTYALPTTLTETDKQSFVPALDPQKSLQVNIGAKGTDNWTLVVHDGLNTNVATVTVANASLPSSGLYEFMYANIFSPVVGATYHFHLYSSVNGGTVVSSALNDITTVQFTTYYQFLLTDVDYHPAMQIANVLAIGNGRYLAVQDAAAGYNSRRLRFPSGWRVRSLALWRSYLAIGCWKGTAIKDFDQGIVFLWDGYSITYNDFFYVPEGGINAMYGENGTLYIVAGYKGDLLEYTGSDAAVKVKRFPRVGKSSYVEVLPGAMTYYGALLRIGVAYNSDSTTLERGVYTWGSLLTRDLTQVPKSLSYDYPISTGNRGSTVQIGALMPVGGSLLMFYQDGTATGVNNISPLNPVQTSGTVEELITDYGSVWKNKDLQVVRADHLPLPAGANVDVKYKLNYEDNWHNLGITSQAVGDQSTRLPIPAPTTQFHGLQIGLDLTATDGNTPTILEHSELTDLLLTETDEHGTY